MNNIYTILKSYHTFYPIGDEYLDKHGDNYYIDETYKLKDAINEVLKSYSSIRIYCAIDDRDRESAYFEYTLVYKGVNNFNAKMHQMQADMFAINTVIVCLAKMFKLESW